MAKQRKDEKRRKKNRGGSAGQSVTGGARKSGGGNKKDRIGRESITRGPVGNTRSTTSYQPPKYQQPAEPITQEALGIRPGDVQQPAQRPDPSTAANLGYRLVDLVYNTPRDYAAGTMSDIKRAGSAVAGQAQQFTAGATAAAQGRDIPTITGSQPQNTQARDSLSDPRASERVKLQQQTPAPGGGGQPGLGQQPQQQQQTIPQPVPPPQYGQAAGYMPQAPEAQQQAPQSAMTPYSPEILDRYQQAGGDPQSRGELAGFAQQAPQQQPSIEETSAQMTQLARQVARTGNMDAFERLQQMAPNQAGELIRGEREMMRAEEQSRAVEAMQAGTNQFTGAGGEQMGVTSPLMAQQRTDGQAGISGADGPLTYRADWNQGQQQQGPIDTGTPFASTPRQAFEAVTGDEQTGRLANLQHQMQGGQPFMQQVRTQGAQEALSESAEAYRPILEQAQQAAPTAQQARQAQRQGQQPQTLEQQVMMERLKQLRQERQQKASQLSDREQRQLDILETQINNLTRSDGAMLPESKQQLDQLTNRYNYYVGGSIALPNGDTYTADEIDKMAQQSGMDPIEVVNQLYLKTQGQNGGQ